MMRSILFFSVSLVFPLSGIELHYQLDQTTESKWEWDRTPSSNINVRATQRLEGILEKEEPQYQFALQKLHFAVREGSKSTQVSLEEPGQMIEMVELQALRGKPIPFSIALASPYVHFSDQFLQQFGALRSIKTPFLSGLIGEELHTLLEIEKSPLKLGESYDIVDQALYKKKKTFVLKEITPSSYIVEVSLLIDRQRIALNDAPDSTVVYGHSVSTYKIDRQNALCFECEGFMTFSIAMKVDDTEAIETHSIHRQVATQEIP